MITHLHIPSAVGPSHNMAVLPVYTERQLITMFYKSVHHNEPQEGFDSWLSAVQNQLSVVEQLPSRDQSFYLEVHGTILQEFKTKNKKEIRMEIRDLKFIIRNYFNPKISGSFLIKAISLNCSLASFAGLPRYFLPSSMSYMIPA